MNKIAILKKYLQQNIQDQIIAIHNENFRILTDVRYEECEADMLEFRGNISKDNNINGRRR